MHHVCPFKRSGAPLRDDPFNCYPKQHISVHIIFLHYCNLEREGHSVCGYVGNSAKGDKKMRESEILYRSLSATVSLLAQSVVRIYSKEILRNLRRNSFNFRFFNETISTIEDCRLSAQAKKCIQPDAENNSAESTKEQRKGVLKVHWTPTAPASSINVAQ